MIRFDIALAYAEPLSCLAALLVMQQRRQIIPFRFCAIFLAVRMTSTFLLLALLNFVGKKLPVGTFYPIYFYVYWISYASESVLGLCMVYEVYSLAMAPLRGLRTLGMLMFRWAGAIAIAVAIGMALGPQLTGTRFVIRAINQLEQTQSILTLCLLLFVCLAIRPMGLSSRSRIFGVSLGLGILSTSQLIQSAWFSHAPRFTSFVSLSTSIAFLTAVLTWTVYFALPEPRRRMIVLPTTSPFLRWNQISLALGDSPGFVAIGGVHPELFAPAEVEIMRRASVKMNAASTYS